MFFVAAVAVAIACVCLIPRTRINTDMTRYLPDDSRMKQGIEQMTEEFGEEGVGTGISRVMFWSLPDSLRVTTKEEIAAIDGVSSILYQQGVEEYNRGEKVLYELLCGNQRSQREIAEEISDKYGSNVVVETSEQGTTAPLGVILIAFVLLLIVLFIMCESWLEPPIFLVAIGVAVAVNMGTNALLRSVSATTNSIAAILQLVLSIDYSIILMNRYRQERFSGEDKFTAMTIALKKASSSIVSSAFTTIVGLMALVFMKFKIGADMGIVLAKGVLCSLVSIFTVLPTLILAGDESIEKAKKKVLQFKTERLAGFSIKYSIPLAVFFVAIFATAFLLHKRTEITFSSEQKSEIAQYFPQKNIIVLLYENADSDRVIALSDSLSENKNVTSFISYPSLMQKGLTVTDTKKMVDGLPNNGYAISDDVVNMAVDVIYFMASTNLSEETMSLHDMALLAVDYGTDSTISAYFGRPFAIGQNELQDLNSFVTLTDTTMIDSPLTAEELSGILGVDQELVSILCPDDQTMSIREMIQSAKELIDESTTPQYHSIKTPEPQHVEQPEQQEVVLDEVAIDTLITEEDLSPAETASVSDQDRIYTDSTVFLRQYSSDEIAHIIGMKERPASLIFILYGRTTGQKTKTMSLYDYIHFIINDLANRKMFASQIDEERRKWLKEKDDLMTATLRSGKNVVVEEETVVEVEEEPTEPPVEIVTPQIVTPQTITPQEAPKPVTAISEENKEYLEKLNQAERIMDIATVGSLYNAVGMQALLSELGTEMELRDIELAYLYHGITHFERDNMKLSAEELMATLNDSIIDSPRFAPWINDEMRTGMDKVNTSIAENLGRLRGDKYSQAIVFTELPKESDETNAFVEALSAQCDTQLAGDHYLIGESVMMNEMRNQFSGEMLLVTLITVLSIFLIVALTFRSVVVPAILVMTVMTAVYINVTLSGLFGDLLYLAYLIMQSILMGATIDYGILFTNNYREARATHNKLNSICQAYKMSTHTIITSGMIMTLAPLAMSFMLDDPTIVMILRCIAVGAFACLLLIIFILPGLLAAYDRFVIRRRPKKESKPIE